jgi:hypothetical protein
MEAAYNLWRPLCHNLWFGERRGFVVTHAAIVKRRGMRRWACSGRDSASVRSQGALTGYNALVPKLDHASRIGAPNIDTMEISVYLLVFRAVIMQSRCLRVIRQY